MKIALTEANGNVIEIEVSEIKRYRETDYPTKDSTWIEMQNGTEFRVIEHFDTVDDLVEKNTEQ